MYYIFSDASYRAKDGTGVLAYLVVASCEGEISLPTAPESIILQSTKESSNIRCELRSVLAALDYFDKNFGRAPNQPLSLYTDCQAIVGLNARRARLEKTQFLSGKTGLPLNNADLYRQIFTAFDQMSPDVHWIKGHSRGASTNPIQTIFASVDQAARSYLRSIP